jgi:hypothetical protein
MDWKNVENTSQNIAPEALTENIIFVLSDMPTFMLLLR